MDPQLVEILGPPPILSDENVDTYNALHDRMRSSIVPQDVMEEMWVRDVVDHTWEILRYRRMKATLIDLRKPQCIKRILTELVEDPFELDRLVAGWMDGKSRIMRRIDRILASADYDSESVTAETMAANLHQIEGFDHRTAQAEARRNAALREMDRHREALARRAREAIVETEDAEFEDVTDPSAPLVPTYEGEVAAEDSTGSDDEEEVA